MSAEDERSREIAQEFGFVGDIEGTLKKLETEANKKRKTATADQKRWIDRLHARIATLRDFTAKGGLDTEIAVWHALLVYRDGVGLSLPDYALQLESEKQSKRAQKPRKEPLPKTIFKEILESGKRTWEEILESLEYDPRIDEVDEERIHFLDADSITLKRAKNLVGEIRRQHPELRKR